MRNRTFVAFGIAAVAAISSCGGTKTVYITNTEPPETTAKKATTTDAPIATAPLTAPQPAYTAEDEFIFDVKTSYGPLVDDEQEVIDVGYATCSFLRQGGSGDDLVSTAMSAIGAGGDQALIVAVIASALTNLCPDQAWKIN